ncbi:MAG TPA: CbiX/SirB N-terminal domain-containing protein, partial [Gammaproteobacteria bacterium]|nr:CbiX/SirB N-terminal domain-containing protein [Gammaproteobacteria bacterium]
AGATQVTVLPYFLNSGRHVVEDIPNEVNHARANNPKSDIKIAQHLGASELMMELLIRSASVVR